MSNLNEDEKAIQVNKLVVETGKSFDECKAMLEKKLWQYNEALEGFSGQEVMYTEAD